MKENNTRDPTSLKMTSMNDLLTPSLLSAIQKLADKIPDKYSRGTTARFLNQTTNGTLGNPCDITVVIPSPNNQSFGPPREDNANMKEIIRISSMLSDHKYTKTDIIKELLRFLIRGGSEIDVLYFASKMFFCLEDYETSTQLFERILVDYYGFETQVKDVPVVKTMIKTCIIGCFASRIRQGASPNEVVSILFNSKFIDTQDLIDCFKETETSLCTGISQENLLILVQQQQQQQQRQQLCNHMITN